MSERRIAGFLCREVLAALPDYLDGGLAEDAQQRIEQHLQGCDWCARFGGDYADAVSALRRALAAAPPVPEELRRRLRSRLAAEHGDPPASP